MMKKGIFLSQIMLTLIQGMVYFLSNKGEINFFIVNFSAYSVILSFILSWQFRKRTEIRSFGFSIIVFFIVMSWIISFQVPLEIVYGNLALLDANLNLVYDSTIINNLVAFCSLMLNFFLIGVTYSYANYRTLLSEDKKNNFRKINSYPILILIFVSFGLFLAVFNKDYSHGDVEIDSLSASFYGLLIKLSVIYLAIKLFNAKTVKMNFITYIYSLNIYYLILITVCCLIFFLAGNRIYSIMVLIPLVFSYFIASKKRVNVLVVVGFFLALSVLGLLFKIYGFVDFYKQGFYIDDNYTFAKFFFPFTAELAGSFYSNNILFSMWDNGFSLHGVSYLVGFLRVVPGLMGGLNISPLVYDSAVIATLYSGASYGVGTTAIVDLLVNFGLIISLIIFVFIGYFFGRSELKAYLCENSIYNYVIFLTITILILFYPRASMNDLISMILFNFIFCKFYISIFKSGSK